MRFPLLLLAAVLPAAAPALAQRADGIAAVVNEEVILHSDVDEQLALFLARSAIRPDSTRMDTLRGRVLDQLIEEKLVVAEAERQKITVSEGELAAQVERAVDEARQRLGSEEAFRRQLESEGLTEERLRERYRKDLRRQIMALRLVDRQFPRKPVTAQEAEAYFRSNRDKFPKAPPEAQLSVILVPVEPDSAAVEAGRRRALDVRKRIRDGERFAKVAQEVSEDPGSARAGGDLGFFGRGRMDPAFEEAAFSLPPYRTSDPVRTPFGWHLIEVLERDTVKARAGKSAGKDSLDAAGKPVVEVHARHILLRVPLDPADETRARALAERVRAEAAKGTDFAVLARRYSRLEGADPSGDVGWRSYAELNDHVRAAVDTSEVGEITPVVRSPSGFSIFKVRDKRPEREYALEEIRDRLPEAVADIQARERYDVWVKSLRGKAHVQIRGS